jgi:hypothetical protein
MLKAGVVAFLFGGAVWFATSSYLSAQGASVTDAQLSAIGTALIALSGSALGFLVTALSIFATLLDRDLIKRLINTGHFKGLITLMFIAAAAFLLSTLVGIAALFAAHSTAMTVTAIATGLTACALLLLSLAGYRFYLILVNS